MLVIRRRVGESILVGDQVEITVIEATPNRVKLGITAPREVAVLRKEVKLTSEENSRAARGVTVEALRDLVRSLWPGADRGKPA